MLFIDRLLAEVLLVSGLSRERMGALLLSTQISLIHLPSKLRECVHNSLTGPSLSVAYHVLIDKEEE